MENKPDSRRKFIIELLAYICIVVLLVILVPRYVLHRTVVDGESMESTLYNGESLMVEKVSRYFTNPKRFQIIIFQPPYDEDLFVKRVIGLPGENIRIHDNVIYINGEPLEESYGKNEMVTGGIADLKEGINLGEDEFFVLGDNREISRDSRDETVGIVKKSQIDGIPLLRIWPLSKFSTVK